MILVIAIGAVSAIDTNATSEIDSSISEDISADEVTEEYTDVSLNVKVDYEYSNDANTVEPDFYVSADSKGIDFTKTYNSATKNYELKLV